MTQPFKVCSRCGQRAVLQMAQCGRCGLPFPPQVSPPAYPAAQMPDYTQPAPPSYARPSLSAGSQRELQRAAAAATRRRSPVLPIVAALLLITLVAVGIERTIRGMRELGGNPISSVMGSGAEADGSVPDPTGSLFHERPSSQEKPTLTVNNGAFVDLRVVLRARDGKEYYVEVQPFESGKLQVPAGQYDLTVSGTGVQSNHGDATFRRYKEYDATFVIDIFADPIHLGD